MIQKDRKGVSLKAVGEKHLDGSFLSIHVNFLPDAAPLLRPPSEEACFLPDRGCPLFDIAQGVC